MTEYGRLADPEVVSGIALVARGCCGNIYYADEIVSLSRNWLVGVAAAGSFMRADHSGAAAFLALMAGGPNSQSDMANASRDHSDDHDCCRFCFRHGLDFCGSMDSLLGWLVSMVIG